MDKTLGQIAFEAGEKGGGWERTWDDLRHAQQYEWQLIADSVAAAVKEEDARICLSMRYSGGSPDKFAAAIRASIKEVK